jgi:hypothetical protein
METFVVFFEHGHAFFRIRTLMRREGEAIASCCLAVLVALYVVGAVSHGSLRHEVQTLPLWFPIVLGFKRREIAKWCALPCLIFWLAIMVLIWLLLLGWTRVISGHFSPVEIAMTMVVGLACAWGIVTSLRWRTTVGTGVALGSLLLFAGLQVLAFRLSLIPFIAGQ